MQAFFSVIIPLYNKEKYITQTLESVLSQSFTNFEVIIVNDGSTDMSLAEVEKIYDDRIKIFNQKNKGASAARNFGIDVSKTDYIAFIDADDLWHKEHLQIIYNLIADYPKAGMFSTGYLMSYNSNSKKSKIKGIPEGFKGIIPDFFESCLYDTPVNSSVVVITKAVLKKLKGFDENIKSGQDIDLWIRIALKNKVAIHNIISATYVKNDASLSNSLLAMDKIKYLNKFKDYEETNISLKKFMDMNRFSVAILYKILNTIELSNSIYASIDKVNLNLKQRFIYNLPQVVLKFLYSLKKNLDKKGMFFHLYR